MDSEATIQILRDNRGHLETVAVVMPTWEKEGDDGSTIIDMPFFGMRLFAFDDMDVDQITHDAIKSFCANCDTFGLGLETELITIGWEKVDDTTMVYTMKNTNIVIDQMLHTGEQFPQFVDFKHEKELEYAG